MTPESSALEPHFTTVAKSLIRRAIGGVSNHDEAGEVLLLEHEIDPSVVQCCVTHAQWATRECSLEELLVALADALWKGVRREALEQRVIAEVGRVLGVDPWSVFVPLDTCFERIAEWRSRSAQEERVARRLDFDASAPIVDEQGRFQLKRVPFASS